MNVEHELCIGEKKVRKDERERESESEQFKILTIKSLILESFHLFM